MRTVCVTVAEVLEGGTKQEFYADLRKSLDLSVRVANIATTECAKQDDLSADKAPKIYTYPAIAKSGIAVGSSQLAASICRHVEKSYKQDRWHIARGKKSLRCYRSQPWPLLSNASSHTLQLTSEPEFITAKIKLLGGWWTVRLAGGSNYRDQIKTLRKVVEDGSYGDSKIWTDRKHKAILGIACDIPVAERKALRGVMSVASSRESLLVATFERLDIPFVINADICHQWQGEANKRYQRLRQDRKSDANRRRIRREMNSISQKLQQRMKTLCHEVSARIVNKAIRAGVAEIKLDLTVKSYAKAFPWYELAGKIKYKAESAGIKVTDATQSVSEPEVDKPHVYFKYAPIAGRVKIGMTGREDGGRHGAETDSPEELTILAIDNQPKAKLRGEREAFSCDV